MLYYLPLECYQSRYTMQWSAAKTGWLERNWIASGIDYKRIDPSEGEVKVIREGRVLDAVGRSIHCFGQVEELLRLAEAGEVTGQDVVYFDDFWHPGIEAIPYAFALLGMECPKMYAFLFAQSVDEFDFTYPMRHWMRHFEKGIAEILSGVFLCCQTLKDLVVFGGIAPEHKVHVTGHAFSSEEVLSRMPPQPWHREDKVVYSSRWDAEKNPQIFLEVAKRVIAGDPGVKFVVCSGAPTLRSNAGLADAAYAMAAEFGEQFQVKTNLTKAEYYAELCSAKIQFNCADQDFVPLTLLESLTAGCFPLYPYFRSFPDTFREHRQCLYEHKDVEHAVRKINHILVRDDLWADVEVEHRQQMSLPHDSSWVRMLWHMGYRYEWMHEHSLRDLV